MSNGRTMSSLSSRLIQKTLVLNTNTSSIVCRQMGTGSRGARGHGWFQKYREGKGGRHLQGRYHYRNIPELLEINDQVFSFNRTTSTENNSVYLDIAVDNDRNDIHRIVIELASKALPVTCTNFRNLCNSHNTTSDDVCCDWGYQNTNVFKIEKNVGLCMGDVVGLDGKGGMCHPSVWENTKIPYTFAHESQAISHAEPGIVSMLSSGLDKNDSRFIITTHDAPQLDGLYVAFGRVQQGMDFIQHLSQSIYTRKGKPSVNIQIVSCGSL